MHWQYWPRTVTTSANTPVSGPQIDQWPIVQGQLRQFRIQIPAGHNGRTGLKINYHGTEVIPWNLNSWLIGSGEVFTIPWGDEIMETGLSIITYNIDSMAHTFYLYAEVWPTVEPVVQFSPGGLFAPPHSQPGHAKVAALHGGRVPVA